MNKNLNSSLNEDLIRRVYDAAYIRRVGIVETSEPVQVCLDSRMLDVFGGGVTTYASVLAKCLPRAGAAPMLLRQSEDGQTRRTPKTKRWIAATRSGARTAKHSPASAVDQSLHELICDDVFREAQVFFNLHRRLMPVSAETPPRVMHWTYPVPLYFEGSLNIYTVHDVIPVTRPDLTNISHSRHCDLLDRIAECAHRIVAVSEAAREDIAKTVPIAPSRVVSLSQAVDISLQSDPPLPSYLNAGRYFIFCGTIDPRKNLVMTARAHARSGSPLPLVIVGADGWRAPEIHRELASMSNVIVLPWQERPMLLALIRNARALVFASQAEGFGLPIAEAMTLGTPVITSTLAATMEVAGDAALLVDPNSLDDIARAFTELGSDDPLAARLRKAGFVRANYFTLDRYAVRLRDFYASLVADEPPGHVSNGNLI